MMCGNTTHVDPVQDTRLGLNLYYSFIFASVSDTGFDVHRLDGNQ